MGNSLGDRMGWSKLRMCSGVMFGLPEKWERGWKMLEAARIVRLPATKEWVWRRYATFLVNFSFFGGLRSVATTERLPEK